MREPSASRRSPQVSPAPEAHVRADAARLALEPELDVEGELAVGARPVAGPARGRPRRGRRGPGLAHRGRAGRRRRPPPTGRSTCARARRARPPPRWPRRRARSCGRRPRPRPACPRRPAARRRGGRASVTATVPSERASRSTARPPPTRRTRRSTCASVAVRRRRDDAGHVIRRAGASAGAHEADGPGDLAADARAQGRARPCGPGGQRRRPEDGGDEEEQGDELGARLALLRSSPPGGHAGRLPRRVTGGRVDAAGAPRLCADLRAGAPDAHRCRYQPPSSRSRKTTRSRPSTVTTSQ